MRKIGCLLLLLLACALALHAQDRTSLDPYRPWVRCWWNGDKVDTVELKRGLQLLHDAGIGVVEINPFDSPSGAGGSQNSSFIMLLIMLLLLYILIFVSNLCRLSINNPSVEWHNMYHPSVG